MSCESNYAQLEQLVPEELQTPTSTGHGSLDLLLRIRAANFWHESLVTLSERQLQSYCKYIIDYMYPHLNDLWEYPQPEHPDDPPPPPVLVRPGNNVELYKVLTFADNTETDMGDIYNYQWWLGYVIGPNSCTRDIAYFCQLLSLPVNEDWYEQLEQTLLEYQRTHTLIEQVTGYGCAETLKRLRLELEGVSTA